MVWRGTTMDIRTLREAGFISRFLHILILAAAIGLGVTFRSRAVVAVMVALWFAVYAVVYLFVKPRPRS
jgi:hypothetical protein